VPLRPYLKSVALLRPAFVTRQTSDGSPPCGNDLGVAIWNEEKTFGLKPDQEFFVGFITSFPSKVKIQEPQNLQIFCKPQCRRASEQLSGFGLVDASCFFRLYKNVTI
jgi:hypothetical protein